MDFGIFIPAQADTWKLVKRAEELGYSRAWFYDTQMLTSELFVSMTAAAMNTSKIRLASGVMIPSNRIAPVAAGGLATLNALAPGRIDWGVSTGSTARSTMGLTRVKQADMEEYILVVLALLSGETLEWEFENKRRKIRFLDPDIGAINIKDAIPLHISAFGPRGRKLIAKLGAGWIDAPGNVARAGANLAEVKAAWAEAGRSTDTLYATAAISGCVLKEGEDPGSERAKSIAGAPGHDHAAQAGRTTDGFVRPPFAADASPFGRSISRGVSIVPTRRCALSFQSSRSFDVFAARRT
ncbi:MAG: LLM class flavin-dependent oxidoreductase [Betaproteobacteria bacterium]|nr:LLM class flavin-dependent oxidoreductase [Betaproteobacteria bacterium]